MMTTSQQAARQLGCTATGHSADELTEVGSLGRLCGISAGTGHGGRPRDLLLLVIFVDIANGAYATEGRGIRVELDAAQEAYRLSPGIYDWTMRETFRDSTPTATPLWKALP
jgi:hypothetical protein